MLICAPPLLEHLSYGTGGRPAGTEGSRDQGIEVGGEEARACAMVCGGVFSFQWSVFSWWELGAAAAEWPIQNGEWGIADW